MDASDALREYSGATESSIWLSATESFRGGDGLESTVVGIPLTATLEAGGGDLANERERVRSECVG